MEDILIKYKPQNLQEVVGNKIQIKRIKDILNNINYDKKIIGIVGPSACGKSIICDLIFKELDFNVLDISKKEQINSKELTQLITNFVNNRTIDSFFKTIKKIIFIDNIDILLSIDKGIISSITNCLEILKKNNIFIVLTCNINDEKKILDFKKEIEIIKVSYPSIKDTFVYILEIFEKEKYEIEGDKVLELVNQYRGNIREIILSLKDSNETHDEVVKQNMFKDMNNFEIVKKLTGGNKYSIDDISSVLNDDTSMISFLLYENIADELYTNRDFKNTSILYNKTFIKSYLSINDVYIQSCIIEDNMYKSRDWSNYNLMNIMRIMTILNILNNVEKKKTYKDIKYRFSQLLSKLSHKNIMNKKIRGINSNRFQIEELICIADKFDSSKVSVDEHNFINTYDKYFSEEI